MIRRFQSAVSYLYYYIGDLISRTPWFCLDRWSWKAYQFCMEESIKLDVDCRIWKVAEPEVVTKSKRRKLRKRSRRRVD